CWADHHRPWSGVLGLDHVNGPTQLMFDETQAQTGLGDGDSAGLAALGRGECVPSSGRQAWPAGQPALQWLRPDRSVAAYDRPLRRLTPHFTP
ncbi:MAG: peptidase, partial [Pseudarthrobacter sp.]|nr:peptidase [Pseudarthrobacter sp.]